MFVFALAELLLTLRENRPAFAPLFQSPPLISRCPLSKPNYAEPPSLLIQAPIILPISLV